MWNVILDGWEPSKAKIDDVEVTLKRNQWNQTQKDEIHKNKRAMITLLYYMSKEEGGKVQYCQSTKKVWETLENHYEGNMQVRSKKVQLHMYEYELFKMKPHESIMEMTNHLNALLTTLKKLGKYFSKEEVNNKILRILPKKDWES